MKRRRFADEVDEYGDSHERHYGPYADEFSDPRYVDIDGNVCLQLVRLFENDIDIQTFSTACMNHALAGGIMFTRQNKRLDDEAADWNNQVWGTWVRQVHKMLFCLGFCLCSFKPHPKFGAEPTVLDLEHIDIRYHLDMHGTPHFRAWEKMDAQHLAFVRNDDDTRGLFSRRPITALKTWCVAAPTRAGVIRSQLTTLIADVLYEQHLLQVSLIADRARARPPLVTQYVQQPYKNTTAAGLTLPSSALPPTDAMAITPRLGDGSQPHQAAYVVNMMNTYSSGDIGGMASRLDNLLKVNLVNSSTEQIYLKDGRELVKQISPEAPHDILLGFRQSRMVRVALSFGMTLPSLTHVPKGVHESSEVKKGGARGRDDDGSRSVYFENYQRELKQRLVIYIHQMYNFIHAGPLAVEAVSEATRNKKALTPQEIQEDIQVNVALPGQPDEDVLYRMYTDGMLKYDAFVNYISSKHSIPMDAFELNPKLDLKELRGITDPPIEASSKSKSKK